ncbi:MAG: hypothetical protein HYX51_08770 [Chloroflexi bacterium]|nr:hypothetical protein [Chloroflexota bacterium]
MNLDSRIRVEVVTRTDTPAGRREIERRLAERGVPVRALTLLDDPARPRYPLPLRCDLRERSFIPPPAGGTEMECASGYLYSPATGLVDYRGLFKMTADKIEAHSEQVRRITEKGEQP